MQQGGNYDNQEQKQTVIETCRNNLISGEIDAIEKDRRLGARQRVFARLGPHRGH